MSLTLLFKCKCSQESGAWSHLFTLTVWLTDQWTAVMFNKGICIDVTFLEQTWLMNRQLKLFWKSFWNWDYSTLYERRADCLWKWYFSLLESAYKYIKIQTTVLILIISPHLHAHNKWRQSCSLPLFDCFSILINFCWTLSLWNENYIFILDLVAA